MAWVLCLAGWHSINMRKKKTILILLIGKRVIKRFPEVTCLGWS